MEKQQKNRYTTRLSGLVILLFGFSVSLGAENLELVIQGDRFTQGERISFDLRINEPDPGKVLMAPLVLPSNLTLLSGPFLKPTVWNSGDQQISGTMASYVLRVNNDGVVELGPFIARVGSQEFKSGSRTLYLLKADEAGRRYPLEYSWSLAPGPYYEGQALALSFYIGNLGYLPNLAGVPLDVPGNALLERTPGIAEMEVHQVGGDSLFRVPYDSWILIPLRAGYITLPPTNYVVDELKRTTPALRFEVRSLPLELKQTRAVGTFSYTTELRQKNLNMGGDLILLQELKGTGNFPYLRFPELDFSGFVLLSQDEENDYKPSSQGYQGTKRIITRLTPQRPGTQIVLLPGFVWMTPESERVFTVPAKDVTVTVNAAPAASRLPGDSLELMDWQEALQTQPWTFYQEPWAWLFILPGLLVFAFWAVKSTLSRFLLVVLLPLFLSFSAGEIKEPPEFTQGVNYHKENRFAEAKNSFDKVLQSYPDNPGILYNRALVAFKEGSLFETQQNLRRALRRAQSLPEASALLLKVQTAAGLQDQWSPSPALSPVVFWVIMMLGINVSLVLFGFWINRRKFNVLSLAVGTLVGALASGVVYTNLLDYQEGPAGVIGITLGNLRRVPGEKAENWMTLAGGTSVRILGSNHGFSLIQTGYGLEGWVADREILRTDSSYFSR